MMLTFSPADWRHKHKASYIDSYLYQMKIARNLPLKISTESDLFPKQYCEII